MSAGQSRFEVVRSTGPKEWHARIVSNGRILFYTAQYARKVGAENAVEVIAGAFINHRTDGAEIQWPANRETQLAEVRYMDLREAGDG